MQKQGFFPVHPDRYAPINVNLKFAGNHHGQSILHHAIKKVRHSIRDDFT
jgi:hypothetical protein